MPTPQTSATMRLIELAERLTPSGEIGDGKVQQFHEAAALARLEQRDGQVQRMARRMGAHFVPRGRPTCYGSRPGAQHQAENGCDDCPLQRECLA